MSGARRLRDESTEEGRKIWQAIDRAADRAPDWAKERVRESFARKTKSAGEQGPDREQR